MKEKSNQLTINLTAVSIALVFLLTIGFIAFLHYSTVVWPKEQTQNAEWSHQVKDSPYNTTLICPANKDGKPIPPESCKRKDHYTSDREYQISDHKAQSHMVYAAWAGFFVGCGGLLLIWWTLMSSQSAARSASDTLRVARMAASLEQRSYIDVEIAHYGSKIGGKSNSTQFNPEVIDGRAKIGFQFRIRNTGNLPNTKCTFFYKARANYITIGTDAEETKVGGFGSFKSHEIGYIGPRAFIDRGLSQEWPVYGVPTPIPVAKGIILAQLEVITLVIFQDEYGEKTRSPIKGILQKWNGVSAFNSKLTPMSGEIVEFEGVNSDSVNSAVNML